MCPRAPAALPRMAGCSLRSIFTTASTDGGLEPPSASPIRPTAATADATTRVSPSLKSWRTAASWFAPAAPMPPSAAAAADRTSGRWSESSLDTSSANFQPSGPTFTRASAAAQRAIRSAALIFAPMHAAERAAARLSSKLSPRSFAMAGADAAACSPMAPRATAAAHLAQPSFASRSLDTGPTMLLASERLQNREVAASRTRASSSPRALSKMVLL
mmetsp:Transcript_73327/g.192265  ORF Transcript_73327/g.192265 Transcript_73327/m.192265 type:complete len:217 (-) Transcript_73327:568-1218(-)